MEEAGGQNSSEGTTASFYSSKTQAMMENSSKLGASFTLKADGKTFVASFGEIESNENPLKEAL